MVNGLRLNPFLEKFSEDEKSINLEDPIYQDLPNQKPLPGETEPTPNGPNPFHLLLSSDHRSSTPLLEPPRRCSEPALTHPTSRIITQLKLKSSNTSDQKPLPGETEPTPNGPNPFHLLLSSDHRSSTPLLEPPRRCSEPALTHPTSRNDFKRRGNCHKMAYNPSVSIIDIEGPTLLYQNHIASEISVETEFVEVLAFKLKSQCVPSFCKTGGLFDKFSYCGC
nr:hypothetical protein CFP56_36940 [Quercus suber]